jgi:hypothetical protein
VPEIVLRNTGHRALVDAEDFARVSAFEWRETSHGYAYRYVDGANVYMHRFVLDATPDMDVDHINGEKLDNRRANIRLATAGQNLANQRTQQRDKTSRFKGVYKSSLCDGWVAQVKVAQHARYLGRFATEEQAARAYDAAARELFGEFARPNFPNEAEPPAARLAPRSTRKSHCKHGHALTEENTFPQTNGGRGCCECRRIQCREYQRRRRMQSRLP